MLISPLIRLALRIAPSRLAFQIELMRLRRWRVTEAEWLILGELVDRRRAAVDVGCNIGLYAGALAGFCPRVHCIEPQANLATALRRKLPRNCVIHTFGASDRNGVADLRVPIADHGRATLGNDNSVLGNVFEVPVRRLDDVLAAESVGFIKIDVEGHEMAVLRGAEMIVTRDRPTLLIESEACHQPGQPFDLFYYLAARGYRGWFHWEGQRLPIEMFRLNVHQRTDFRVYGSSYANNFVFQSTQ